MPTKVMASLFVPFIALSHQPHSHSSHFYVPTKLMASLFVPFIALSEAVVLLALFKPIFPVDTRNDGYR